MSAIPRLTIGLPVYNGQHYLAESLDALLGQTYSDFDLVIADNASTDATEEIGREYAARDPRVRYLRHERNIGAAPNHNFLAHECRTELFKWASADDLYARTLLERCVAALDEYPEVVLAHSWTAAIDDDGTIVQARPYPLATDSPDPVVRYRSMLYNAAGVPEPGAEDSYGVIEADDFYGVMRTAVLQAVSPHHSYYYADRIFQTGLALAGPFHQTPEWLYFRRDHPERAEHANPTVRSRCINLDPRRSNPWLNPAPRLLAEYLLGWAQVVRKSSLTPAQRRECYRVLTTWSTHRAPRSAWRAFGRGKPRQRFRAAGQMPAINVDEIVAGRQRTARGSA